MKKKGLKVAVVALVGLFVGVGGGVGYASANLYFSSNVEALNNTYNNKVEEYMKDPAYIHGAMQTYLTELYPQLEEEAQVYYQESLGKWENNQATLSESEQAEIDSAYEEALNQIKSNIDAKFAQYGGY